MREEACDNPGAEWSDDVDPYGPAHIERHPEKPYLYRYCRGCNGTGRTRVIDWEEA